jgi:hypothetical protein
MSSNTSNSPEAILAESVVAIERKDYGLADQRLEALEIIRGGRIQRGAVLWKTQGEDPGDPPGV